MRRQEPGRASARSTPGWQIVPFEADAASDRLGWAGLEAVRYHLPTPASELNLARTRISTPPLPPRRRTASWWTRSIRSISTRPTIRRSSSGAAARSALRRIDLGGCAGWQPGPVLEWPQGLAPHLPGAGIGRAGRRRGVRPRPGAADGAAARRPEPPATPGRDGGRGCRTDHRRRRGAARRRVAGQRPGRPPDRLILFARPPGDWTCLYEGVKRRVPPAVEVDRCSARWRPGPVPLAWVHGHAQHLPGTGVGREVATEAFDLDPARLTVPPLDGVEFPHLRAAMTAVGAELASGGPGTSCRRVAGQCPGRPTAPPRLTGLAGKFGRGPGAPGGAGPPGRGRRRLATAAMESNFLPSGPSRKGVEHERNAHGAATQRPGGKRSC